MNQDKHVSVTHTELQQWSGPLPAPDSLAKYNSVVPDAAERIIRMAEKEQQHRHEMESKTATRESRLAMTSTILAFLCVILMIALVVYAIYAGSYGTALAAVISAIATVAGIFGLGKLFRAKEK
jgi:uncharacterized membrane protein